MDILPQDNTPRKQCTGPCGRTLPNTPKFFYRNGANTLRPDCKECRNKKTKAYHERPDVHEQRAAYSKDYRQRNADYVKAHKKAYYSQPEVKEHQRNRMQAYRPIYYSIPGKLEHKHAQAKEYVSRPEVQEQRRPYDRTFQHNRRARIKGNGSHTPAQIQEQYTRQKGKCYYCNATMIKYHIDHVIPVARGGSNDISNIVLACPSCNQHKQARLPHEWPKGGRLL